METKPKIRFDGFTDNWEQRKLGDVVSLRGRIGFRGYKETDLVPAGEGAITFSPSDIDEMGIVSTENNKYLSWKKYDESPEIQVQEGDILFTKTASIGKIGYVNQLTEKATINPQLALLTPADGTCGYFTFLSVRNDDFIKQVRGITGGSSVPTMSQEKLKELLFMSPSVEEQNEIGHFFENIDNLITLYQLKYESISYYKESMLQKLFPKKCEKNPEIRFHGFSDNWTAHKLGDLYTERNEKGNNSLQILSVSIHSGVSDGELNEEELGKAVKRSEDKSTYKHVYEGDLIFNMMRAWQGAIGVAKCEGMISPAYISAVPNDKVYPLFMDYALRRSETIAEINNLSYGIRDFRKRLYWNSFIHVNCMLPSIEEQKKIYEFLKSIDAYIDALQKKCSELKTFKKYLLRNMFCKHT